MHHHHHGHGTVHGHSSTILTPTVHAHTDYHHSSGIHHHHTSGRGTFGLLILAGIIIGGPVGLVLAIGGLAGWFSSSVIYTAAFAAAGTAAAGGILALGTLTLAGIGAYMAFGLGCFAYATHYAYKHGHKNSFSETLNKLLNPTSYFAHGRFSIAGLIKAAGCILGMPFLFLGGCVGHATSKCIGHKSHPRYEVLGTDSCASSSVEEVEETIDNDIVYRNFPSPLQAASIAATKKAAKQYDVNDTAVPSLQ